MIKKLINKIWKSEGQEGITTPMNQNAKFVLWFHDLSIGILSIDEGIWKFAYTEEFRKQSDITPLIDFPNKELEYTSAQLWPFFSYRIPGLNQPKVQEIMKKENIHNNEVELLKKFGRFTIYNPFKLQIS